MSKVMRKTFGFDPTFVIYGTAQQILRGSVSYLFDFKSVKHGDKGEVATLN